MKRFTSIFLALGLLLILGAPAQADWVINALTGKLDYYEPAAAVAAHAATHAGGGADPVDHDTLANYVAGQHIVLPNTIAAVLTDHNVAAHNALNITQLGTVTVGVWNGTDIVGGNIDESTVDHDSLLNYVAGQHLVLPGTIAAVLTDHNLAAHTALGLYQEWTGVFIVDAGGTGDYTTIQAALTAENSGGELFLVVPGTYTDDTINFSANDQCIRGMGLTAQALVTTADAAIVNFAARTGCRIENLSISMTAPTTAKDMITGSGSLFLRRCHLSVTNTLVIGADQPTCIDTTGIVKVNMGTLTYNNSGDDTDGATAIKAAIRISGSADVDLNRVNIDLDGAGQSLAIVPAYGTAGVVNMYRCFVDIDDDATSNAIGFVYSNIAAAPHEIFGNDLHIDNSTINAVGIYLLSSETVRSMYNHYHVTSAGGTAYSFNVGGSATLVSQFDDIIAADGTTGAGSITLVSSEADGDLTLTGDLAVTGSATVGSLIGPAAALDINTNIIQDINLWDTIASGNPSLYLFGWNTAGADRELVEFTMDDTNDEFLIQVPNSANNEGVTVSLLQTDQRFRIRKDSDYFSIDVGPTDTTFHTSDGQFLFTTDEGAAAAALWLYDADDTHYSGIDAHATTTGSWLLTLPPAVHARSGLLKADTSGDTAWIDDDAGVCFMMVESDTACTIVNGTVAFTVPATMNGWELVTAIASVTDKGITNTMDIQVRKRSGGADTDMLDTLITMGDEFFAADGVVKSDNSEDVATGDQIYIDTDAIHTGTAANGQSVTLVFRRK